MPDPTLNELRPLHPEDRSQYLFRPIGMRHQRSQLVDA